MSSSEGGAERRAWPRLKLDAEAIIRVDAINEQVRSRILNASGNGLLIALPSPRPVGTRMRITVQIADPQFEIAVVGVIVHVTQRPNVADLPFAIGVFLTEAGSDWTALCRRLAKIPTPPDAP